MGGRSSDTDASAMVQFGIVCSPIVVDAGAMNGTVCHRLWLQLAELCTVSHVSGRSLTVFITGSAQSRSAHTHTQDLHILTKLPLLAASHCKLISRDAPSPRRTWTCASSSGARTFLRRWIRFEGSVRCALSLTTSPAPSARLVTLSAIPRGPFHMTRTR
jgi:hypothetical protein